MSNGLGIWTRWVTGQDCTSVGGLDAGESLQLLRLDGDLSTEANLAGSPLDKGHTVGVQRLVDRSGTGSGLDQGDTSGSEGGLCSSTTVATLTEILDGGSLHGKLDEIEREEPNDVLMKWSILRTGGELERRLTQTQTIPIQPPEMARMLVKPQSP